jgi:hypothetical protein
MDDGSVRALLRVHVSKIWLAKNAGKVLLGEERLLADAIERHPEWATYFERAAEGPLSDEAGITPDGVNPFFAIAAEAAVETMIGKEGSPRETYQALRSRGLSHLESVTEVGRVFLATMFVAKVGELGSVEECQAQFETALKRVRDGETAADIFPADTYKDFT